MCPVSFGASFQWRGLLGSFHETIEPSCLSAANAPHDALTLTKSLPVGALSLALPKVTNVPSLLIAVKGFLMQQRL